MRHAPALQHGDDIAISHPDEILEYIDRTFPFPSLKYSNADADNQTADLFRAFCFFIKEVNKDPKVGVSRRNSLMLDDLGSGDRADPS